MPTATGLRISSVNGTAFLDNCPADIIAAAGTGAQIKIYDASNRYLQGVIVAVGSSEGLGDELITGWVNGIVANTSYYDYETLTVSSNGHDIDLLNHDPNVRIGYSSCRINSYSSLLTTGMCYLLNATRTFNSGTEEPTIRCGQFYSTDAFSVKIKNLPENYYFTPSAATSFLLLYNLYQTANFSVLSSLKQVTAPSSSGVVIKDLSANQNFISKDANFTYNAASYVYEILNVATASQSVFLRKIFQRGF